MSRSVNRAWRTRAWVGVALVSVTVAVSTAAPLEASVPRQVAAPTIQLPSNAGWLSVVNWYRANAGLPPVVEEPSWSAGILAHLNYLRFTPAEFKTGVYANAHTENPASPYYTPAGAEAGGSSNLGGGATQKDAIEGWIQAPFHGVGILRRDLKKVAFAQDATGAAGLDVIRGLEWSGTPPTDPVVFPGDGSTIDRTTYFGELPNPLETCGYPSPAGFPIIAMLPEAPTAALSASLNRPDGTTISSLGSQLCVVSEAHYFSSDTVYGPTGLAILQADHVAFVIPRQPLTPGQYSVALFEPGKPDVTWSFTVAGRPAVGSITRVHVADSPDVLVMGNLTVTEPGTSGFTTAYPCAQGRPLASNNNYVGGQTIPNFAAVRADANGDLCIYTLAASHLIWDQVAEVTTIPSHNAVRKLDTRNGSKPAYGSVTKVHASDVANALVMGNLTVTEPDASGFTTAYPCLQGRPLASNNNYAPGQTIPNFAAVRTDANGDLCIYTLAATHLIWDQVAEVTTIPSHNAVRKLDTRSGPKPGYGSVTKVHAADAPDVLVLGNLTVTEPEASGFTTAYPCLQGRPLASNNNYAPGETIPNFVAVRTDANGDICIYTLAASHLVWDQIGEVTTVPSHNAVRKLDTRRFAY